MCRNINGLIDNKTEACVCKSIFSRLQEIARNSWVGLTIPTQMCYPLTLPTPEGPQPLVQITTHSSISPNSQRGSRIFLMNKSRQLCTPPPFVLNFCHIHWVLLPLTGPAALSWWTWQASARALSLVPGTSLSQTLPPSPAALCHCCARTLKWSDLSMVNGRECSTSLYYILSERTHIWTVQQPFACSLQ